MQDRRVPRSMSLLDELKDWLQWHANRKSMPLDDWFTLQLHERVLGDRHERRFPLGEPYWRWSSVRLEDDHVRVLDDRWPLERLQKFQRWHERDEPERIDPPLVVFRGWDTECLIDGQTRVNFWGKTGNIGPHRVLVVEPLSQIEDPFP
jgi:hypothetical protein